MKIPQKNIVFVDNAEEFWINDMDLYANTVDYIRVPNAQTNSEKKYTMNLAKNGNKYAIHVLKTNSGNYLSKGIDSSIVNTLKTWSRKKSNLHKYALFDWDGTIASTEGFSVNAIATIQQQQLGSESVTFGIDDSPSGLFKMNIPTNYQNKNGGEKQTKSKYSKSLKKRKTRGRKRHINYNSALQNIIYSSEYNKYLKNPLTIPSKEFLDDMFVYIMKPERVQLLRELFRTLLENKVKIHILTHNPYASVTNPFRQIFIEMMWRLFNEDYSEEYSEQYKDINDTFVTVYKSSSRVLSFVSREELDEMLHSTMDYTNVGEQYMKRNIMRGLGTSETH